MTASATQDQAPDERRRSYRCPLIGPRRLARLRIGDVEFDAEVLDESPDGFAVVVAGTPDCRVGQNLLLHIAAAWVEVRVMHLRALPSIPSEDSESPPTGGGMQLGLMRLRDVESWETSAGPAAGFTLASLKSLAVALMPLRRSIGSTVCLVVGTALAGGALLWVLDHSFSDEPVIVRDVPLLPTDPPRLPALKPATPQAATPKRAATRPRPVRPDESRPPAPTRELTEPSVPAQEQDAAPEKETRSLGSGPQVKPDYLLQPEIARLLALSEEQLRKLREILEEYVASVNGGEPLDSAAPVIPNGDGPDNPFVRRSLAVLTELQRASLQQHLAKPRLAPGSVTPDKPDDPRASE